MVSLDQHLQFPSHRSYPLPDRWQKKGEPQERRGMRVRKESLQESKVRRFLQEKYLLYERLTLQGSKREDARTSSSEELVWWQTSEVNCPAQDGGHLGPQRQLVLAAARKPRAPLLRAGFLQHQRHIALQGQLGPRHAFDRELLEALGSLPDLKEALLGIDHQQDTLAYQLPGHGVQVTVQTDSPIVRHFAHEG